MKYKPGTRSVLLFLGSLILLGFAPARAAQAPPGPPPTPQQLDQLLSPIALYPDSLLAQITTAATNPQEVLDVSSWLGQNPGLSGTALTDAAQKQGYDPAFLSLVNFPTVLQMMADNIDDYSAIGQAVTANQAEVSSSIQRLRDQAYKSGALRSNQQQLVQVQQAAQPVYVIQTADPQVVYVPQYNPTAVYVGPSTGQIVATSLITFGVGIGIGALIANNHPWGWNSWAWHWGHGVYYNNGPWGGWHGGYRPPSIWYRPRPVLYTSRPGYGGNWGYRPPNYRPPYPVNRPVYRPPGYYPPPGGGYRPPPSGGYPGHPPNNGNRPGINPPPNNGGRPPTNPGYRPGQPGGQPGRPGINPPPNNGGGRPPQPQTRPAQPQTRPAQPQTRPATQPHRSPQSARPAPQTRPAPQPRPAPQQGKPAGGQGNRGGFGQGKKN